MKHLKVVAAVIWHQNREHILIAKRQAHKFQGGLWEFPGGKVEPGETDEQALRRELKEELDIEVGAVEFLQEITHRYPEKLIQLRFFQTFDILGTIHANEGQDWALVNKQDLHRYTFPEANQSILEKLIAQ